MNILYVSTTCSKKTISNIFNIPNIRIAQSMQKFSYLLLQGFAKEKIQTTALSLIPVDSSDIKHLNIKNKETENNIQYLYTKKSINKYLSVISVFLSSFYQTLIWGIRNKRNNPVIICDVLKVSICFGALLASKVLRIKTLGIVTDIPGLMLSANANIYSKTSFIVNKKYINNFDLYVLLTDEMNELVNLRRRPYLIMEGIVDSTMIKKKSGIKDYPRNIIYAGGIFERYGVKTLIDAFMNIDDNSIQLSIYGDGDLNNYIKECSLKDKRVKYFGVVPNHEVVEAQLKATLLVNPRPTHEEFTKYSFPSKNMEYMVSGTPILTTRLPGMPKEYYDYIYLIDEENINGIEKKIREIISTDEKKLSDLGAKAKDFVLINKNNITQSRRILDFVKY